MVPVVSADTVVQNPPGVGLYDEGTRQGQVQRLDCVGAAIACTKSTITGTLTISSTGAPTTAQYWVGAADATLSAEKDLSGFTALVLNTAGTPSAYAGATGCTNQFFTGLSGTGASTCTTSTLAGAQHANQGTTTTLLHGNAAGNPSWAAASLTADVSGILPTANGGTGIAYFTAAGPTAARVYTFPDAAATMTITVASGAKALATGAIGSAACTSAQTDTATGTATTDTIVATFNGDPTAVTGYVPLTTGMLTIIPYPTANTVNFKVCNNTSASITPGAITLNWRVVR